MNRVAGVLWLAIAVGGCTTAPASPPVSASSRSAPVIRIRLVEASSAPSARLASAGPWRILDAGTGAVLESGPRLDRVVGLRGARAAGPVRIESPESPLMVDGTPYPGALLLSPEDGGVALLVETNLEEYLPGVLAGELGPSFPPAALRAQAVAARTWALQRLQRMPDAPWHVNDDTSSQRFLGLVDPVGGPLRRAVTDTAGLVLLWRGLPLPAYYSSTCGGQTTAAVDVFGGPGPPPLSGVPCGWCTGSPRYKWSIAIPLGEAVSLLSLPGPPSSVEILDRFRDGRTRTLRFGSASAKDLSAVEVRSRLGPGRLPSTLFSAVRIDGGRLVFDGGGFGHGAGLCQWGAIGMARAGAGPGDILAHYYPGSTLSRIY